MAEYIYKTTSRAAKESCWTVFTKVCAFCFKSCQPGRIANTEKGSQPQISHLHSTQTIPNWVSWANALTISIVGGWGEYRQSFEMREKKIKLIEKKNSLSWSTLASLSSYVIPLITPERPLLRLSSLVWKACIPHQTQTQEYSHSYIPSAWHIISIW